MESTANVVFFAIQAGLKLYGGVRKAYCDSTRARPLVLPLPRVKDATAASARTWFTTEAKGQAAAEKNPRVPWLLSQPKLKAEQENELLKIYSALYDEAFPVDAEAEGRGERVLAGAELHALLTVRQWTEDDPTAPRSALQQVAGTLINIAVDYYATTPGAVSEKRGEGRVLLAFLKAVDDVDFANTPAQEVAGELLIGVLDGVAANPDAFCGGELESKFIENVTKSLSGSAKTFLADASTSQKERGAAWLQLVARSLIAGGAETVLANPVRFLGVAEGAESALVSAVGGTIAELLLAEDYEPTFSKLLSGDGLTKVTQSALAAVAANPGLLKVDNQGLKAILVAVAGDLAKYDAPFTSDAFPELARLVLEKTAYNMDLVWGPRFKSADRHLLVTASRSLLRSLAKKPAAGSTWKPTLTQSQILVVAETVFDEVIENPDWLVERAAGEGDALGAAVEAMLDAMRRFDGQRISADGGVAMLRAGILAVGQRIELLDRIPGNGPDAGKVALTAVVDTVMAKILGDKDQVATNWSLARNTALQVVVEIALEELAKHGAGESELDVLHDVLDELTTGEFELDEFARRLGTELAGV